MKLTSLSDIAEVCAGQPAPQNKKYFSEIGYPFIRAGSLEQLLNGSGMESLEHIAESVGNRLKMRLFPKNTILFAKSGMSAKIGRIFSLKKDAYVVSHLAAIIPGHNVNAGYLEKWFIKNPPSKLIPNDSYPSIRLSEIAQLKIPLPPLEEQKRIAAILDKADAIRRKRKEAIRLTEELLRSTFLDMFGDPVTNPKGWDKVKLDAIVTKIDSGWSPKCDSREADSDEWGMLKLGAVTWGHFNSSENKALLPETEPRPELEVKQGDLLFSRKNTYELVGATAYVHSTRSKLLLPDLIFRLCLSEAIDPVYLWQALSRKTMRNELSLLASGSSGSMPNISKTRLKNLLVPLPPLDLQLKYREIINKFWSYEGCQKKNVLHADNLFNSLLQKAFRGEL